MTDIKRTGASKADAWAARIAAQQRSGTSVKQFCSREGLSEYSFYAWRKRLRDREPIRFALVERDVARPAAEVALELVLATGDRLRIGAGVDGATLRTVMEALRR